MAGQGEEDRASYTGISLNIIKTGFKKFVNLFDGGPPECKMPGCKQRCYVEDDGYVHDFCGRSHAKEYRAMEEEAEWREQMRKKQEAQNALHACSGTTVDTDWEHIGHDNRFSQYPVSFEGIIIL